MKQKIIQLLRSTNREGMENVINWLEQSDFFTAPASTTFHGNYEGGLAQHSFNVYQTALDLFELMKQRKPSLAGIVSRENIIIAALLHDVCKVNIYKQTTKYRKDTNGTWETYNAYIVDYSEFPLGHGEKSVIRLLKLGLSLTDSEIIAIRWHMNAWDLPFQSLEMKSNINVARDKCPLLCLVQSADGIASSILESDT